MSLFDFVRDQVGLELIVSVNGSGKVRCVSPDHHDEDPSMHLYDDHAHCFGGPPCAAWTDHSRRCWIWPGSSA